MLCVNYTGAVRPLIAVVVSVVAVVPVLVAGLTVITLMLGLLLGPISCGLRPPATDAAILLP